MLFRYPLKTKTHKRNYAHISSKLGKNPFHESFPHIEPVFILCKLSQSPSLLVFLSSSILSFAGIVKQRTEGIQPVLSQCLCVLDGGNSGRMGRKGVWVMGGFGGLAGGVSWTRHGERSQPGTVWTSARRSIGEIPTAEVGARAICVADCVHAGSRARVS